ncbi:hypothetical protein LSAT2_030954 [Lamellibrachia satsuma]|nr:hypothetical protein LSAT2_030954 [Lamellibrachia satsuma]
MGVQVSQKTGGKGDRLMSEREPDNSLPPSDKAAGQNVMEGIHWKSYSEAVMEGGVLQRELSIVGEFLQQQDTVRLPLNPAMEVISFDVKSCSYFSSNTFPLRLVMRNVDLQAESVYTMFKISEDSVARVIIKVSCGQLIGDSETEESRGSENEESRVSETEESRGSETEESRGSENEESRISETEESRGSENEESRVSETEESRNSETEESRGSENEESRVSETEESRGSETEESRGSENEESSGNVREKAGAKTEDIAAKAGQVMGGGMGGAILVHVGMNNAEKEGTSAIVGRIDEKEREVE